MDWKSRTALSLLGSKAVGCRWGDVDQIQRILNHLHPNLTSSASNIQVIPYVICIRMVCRPHVDGITVETWKLQITHTFHRYSCNWFIHVQIKTWFYKTSRKIKIECNVAKKTLQKSPAGIMVFLTHYQFSPKESFFLVSKYEKEFSKVNPLITDPK